MKRVATCFVYIRRVSNRRSLRHRLPACPFRWRTTAPYVKVNKMNDSFEIAVLTESKHIGEHASGARSEKGGDICSSGNRIVSAPFLLTGANTWLIGMITLCGCSYAADDKEPDVRAATIHLSRPDEAVDLKPLTRKKIDEILANGPVRNDQRPGEFRRGIVIEIDGRLLWCRPDGLMIEVVGKTNYYYRSEWWAKIYLEFRRRHQNGEEPQELLEGIVEFMEETLAKSKDDSGDD
jgi:hypothetical protein